jgi:hypothetical protein
MAAQFITLDETKAKGREFYDAGKLTAQHPETDKRQCVIDGGDGYRCVVGSVLTDETIAKVHEAIMNNSGAHMLFNKRLIDADTTPIDDDRSEFSEIEALQNAHDDWARNAYCDDDGIESAKTYAARATFLYLIEHPSLFEASAT